MRVPRGGPRPRRKSADAAYVKAMQAVAGTYPAKYRKELAAALIAGQQAGVDKVSGATSGFFNALARADQPAALISALPIPA